ncbi:glycoside hydrolase family 28 protein [Flavitalea antarctica]
MGKFLFLVFVFSLINRSAYPQASFNVESFGAIGDGNTINTKFIQDAIDKCNTEGGGRVLIPNGVFMTGTIYLKSNVTLYLSETAILKGVVDSTAYPDQSASWIKRSQQKIKADSAYSNRALIYAFEQKNIGIGGKGKIYGQGEHPLYRGNLKHGRPNRPHAVYLVKCEEISLKDLTLLNSACWGFRLAQCKNITYDNIQLISRVVGNNDGLDIVDCWNMVVSNSFFDCGDDCICPKSDPTWG